MTIKAPKTQRKPWGALTTSTPMGDSKLNNQHALPEGHVALLFLLPKYVTGLLSIADIP